jgi:hypothetical protein
LFRNRGQYLCSALAGQQKSVRIWLKLCYF